MENLKVWKQQLEQLLIEMEEQTRLPKGGLFVVGCSTSEVAGKSIGTSGAFEVAEALYGPLTQFAKRHELFLAFQGCEHINRALTIEQQAAEKYNLDSVSVIPVLSAGGAMSAFAYQNLEEPVLVEELKAHAGIDIGQTLIGMHLKPVAVPIRTSVHNIGSAVVTIATTRPKKIGGERAIYTLKTKGE